MQVGMQKLCLTTLHLSTNQLYSPLCENLGQMGIWDKWCIVNEDELSCLYDTLALE